MRGNAAKKNPECPFAPLSSGERHDHHDPVIPTDAVSWLQDIVPPQENELVKGFFKSRPQVGAQMGMVLQDRLNKILHPGFSGEIEFLPGFTVAKRGEQPNPHLQESSGDLKPSERLRQGNPLLRPSPGLIVFIEHFFQGRQVGRIAGRRLGQGEQTLGQGIILPADTPVQID